MGINFNDPLVQSTLLRGGLDLLGGSLSGMGQGRMSEAQIAAQRQRDQVDALLALLRESGSRADSQMVNQRLGMQAAGSLLESPLKQQNERQNMALRRALLFDGPGGGPQYVRPGPQSTVGGYMAQNLPRYDSARPFFTDSAMANAEVPFWETVAGLTGGQVRPNLPGSGYQGVGEAQGRIDAASSSAAGAVAARNSALSDEMTNTRAAVTQALGSPAQTGRTGGRGRGGFWRTLGRIGAVAAPFIAAPFTGGSSLAMLGIGAGAGAASGALGGGGMRGALTGALSGAATSALPGMLRGRMPRGVGFEGNTDIIGRLAPGQGMPTPLPSYNFNPLPRAIARGVRFGGR